MFCSLYYLLCLLSSYSILSYIMHFHSWLNRVVLIFYENHFVFEFHPCVHKLISIRDKITTSDIMVLMILLSFLFRYYTFRQFFDAVNETQYGQKSLQTLLIKTSLQHSLPELRSLPSRFRIHGILYPYNIVKCVEDYK